MSRQSAVLNGSGDTLRRFVDEIPDAEVIRSKLEQNDAERKLLKQLLRVSVRKDAVTLTNSGGRRDA